MPDGGTGELWNPLFHKDDGRDELHLRTAGQTARQLLQQGCASGHCQEARAEKEDATKYYIAHTFMHRYILGFVNQFLELGKKILEMPEEVKKEAVVAETVEQPKPGRASGDNR